MSAQPSGLCKLIAPLPEEAEVTLSTRDEIPRRSEKVINVLTNPSVKCPDAGTGFHAAKADIAKKNENARNMVAQDLRFGGSQAWSQNSGNPRSSKVKNLCRRKSENKTRKTFLYVLKDLIC